MNITKKDYLYAEQLVRSLDEIGWSRFLGLLESADIGRDGSEVTKFTIVSDPIPERMALAPNDFVTRTMIKKAYQAAMEGK